MGRAIIQNQNNGLVKVFYEEDGPIVGASVCGPAAGEVIHELMYMVGWEVLPKEAADFIHAHPTLSEAVGEALMSASGKGLHLMSLDPIESVGYDTSLSKEALSSGDITLSENYLQHADHFMRVIEDKNRNRNQTKVDVVEKSISDNKNSSINQNTNKEDENKIKN